MGAAGAVCSRRERAGVASCASMTMRSGLGPRAGEAHGHQRIVGPDGADADHDRVVGGAQDVDEPVGGHAGDGEAGIVRAAGGEAVRRFRELQGHGGPALAHPQQVSTVVAPGGIRADTADHLDPMLAAVGEAAPGNEGVGVLDGVNQARNAGRDHGLAAGWRRAVVAARFQRDVKRRAPGVRPGLRQRDALAVRATAVAGAAAPDDAPRLDHERADAGVGRGAPQAVPAERQGRVHEASIVRRDAVAGSRHRRSGACPAAPAASASPESSSINVLKSRVSRKSR